MSRSRPGSSAKAGRSSCRYTACEQKTRSILVGHFAVLGDVEPESLLPLLDTQAHDEVNCLKDQPGRAGGVYPRGRHGQKLDPELARIAVEQAVGPGGVHRHRGKDTGGQGAPRAAYAVAAPDVEGIVHAE